MRPLYPDIRTNQEYRMGPTTPDKNWRVNRALAGGGPLEDLGIYGLQAALYLSGEIPPPSTLHFYYVGMELIKVGCLLTFGIGLFKKVPL